MKSDREKRPIFFIVRAGALIPASMADVEVLDRYKIDSEVEVTFKQRRSLPALQAYWAGLHRVVEAVDNYPSSEHLHNAIKMALKLVTPVMTFEGKLIYVPDSVAISAMDDAEFAEFFKRAQRLVIERFGFDPWSRETTP